MVDELAKKRVEKLVEKGITLIEKERYNEALEVADELEWEKGPLAFYIAGQAYAGLKDFKAAVRVMRRGVLIHPEFWWNWFYLGAFLSSLKKKEEALAAYHQALLCPTVDAELVHLNMAMVAVECSQFDNALAYLDNIKKPLMRWSVDGCRIVALEGVGRFAEAAGLAEDFLRARPKEDDDYDSMVGFVAAVLARSRLRQGSGAEEVCEFLMQCLEEHGCRKPILAEIRNLDLRYHQEAKLYRICISVTLPIGHPWRREAGGYGVVYDVVSVSVPEAVTMIHEVERRVGVDTVEILDSMVIEEKPEVALGIYWFSERKF